MLRQASRWMSSHPKASFSAPSPARRACTERSSAVHPHVQTLQRTRADQLEISLFGEDDFIHGLRFIHPKDRVANRSRNDLTVRQLKLEILLSSLDPECVQYLRVDPRGLGAGVDHQPTHDS